MSQPPPPSYDAASTMSSEQAPPIMNKGVPPNDPAYPPNAAGAAYPPNPAYPLNPAYPPGEGYPPPASNPASPPPYKDNVDVESQLNLVKDTDDSHHQSDVEFNIISFDDKLVRLGFIRKVFIILAAQMVVTMAMLCWFQFHEPTKLYVQSSLPLYITSYVLFFVLYIVLACCTGVARKHPYNLVLLGIFTLSLSYLVAAIATFHKTPIVLGVFGITMLISGCIILFASQTKYDFTTCGGILFVLCLSLFFFGIMAGIMLPNKYMSAANVCYSGLGALLFMIFLAVDTQLIIGGYRYEIDPEDYVFAAMMLYVDIIYIFLYLLSLFSGD